MRQRRADRSTHTLVQFMRGRWLASFSAAAAGPSGLLGGAALLAAALACGTTERTRAASEPQQVRTITEAHGAIAAVRPDAGWWGIVPDTDRGTRYAPDRLPDEFKIDGLRVVFSGRVKPVDPNVRTWGTPLEITEIRRE